MFEILTHIFDTSITIQPYNVRDFNPHFELIMLVNLAQKFDISTKIRDILNKRFKLFTNILEIQSKIKDILPKFQYFDSKFCQNFEKILDKISRIWFKTYSKTLKISGHIDKNKKSHSETAPPPPFYINQKTQNIISHKNHQKYSYYRPQKSKIASNIQYTIDNKKSKSNTKHQ